MKRSAYIIDLIGMDAMAAGLDVSKDRIYRARHAERLPAMWFDFCERQLGKTLPRDLFTFK